MYTKRLFIVVLITYAVASATGFLFDKRYKKRFQLPFFDKMDVILSHKQDYDVLFLGNSRTHFGINPYYIDSITGLQSYNLGQGGSDAEEMLLYSTLYLSNHKAPKFTILNLDGSTVLKHDRLKDRYWNLFLLNNDTINAYMKKAGFNTTIIRYLPFLKYSFFDEYSRSSIFLNEPSVPRFDHNIYKGFANIYKELREDTIHWQKINEFNPSAKNEDEEKISDTAVNNLKKIAGMFIKKGSRVIIVYPPGIKSTDSKRINYMQSVDSIYTNISSALNIPVYDANKLYVFPEKYFSDISHLNEPGTKIFSKMIGQYLDSMNKR